jgi:hypothetical protein
MTHASGRELRRAGREACFPPFSHPSPPSPRRHISNRPDSYTPLPPTLDLFDSRVTVLSHL